MQAIVVSPPLRGEWNVFNTPGDKVPSHATHEWGMTYAFDFARLGTKNGAKTWHKKSSIAYLLGQVKLSDTFGWGEPVYAPIDGVVRQVIASVPERQRLHIVTDLGLALWRGWFFSYARGKPEQLGGNSLIIEGEQGCAFLAHVRRGSIQHRVGDTVRAGEVVAAVGHSGNSTIPHLHFQMMDRVDLKSARGLPCCFANYAVNINDQWQKVECGIPTSQYTLRFEGESLGPLRAVALENSHQSLTAKRAKG